MINRIKLLTTSNPLLRLILSLSIIGIVLSIIIVAINAPGNTGCSQTSQAGTAALALLSAVGLGWLVVFLRTCYEVDHTTPNSSHRIVKFIFIGLGTAAAAIVLFMILDFWLFFCF